LSVYTATANRALAQIKRRGGVGTLTRNAESFDPVSQIKNNTPTSYPFRAVADQISKRSHGAAEQTGSLVNRNIQYLIVAAKSLAIEPVLGDKVAWAGKDWNVIWFSKTDPTGVDPILYEIFVER